MSPLPYLINKARLSEFLYLASEHIHSWLPFFTTLLMSLCLRHSSHWHIVILNIQPTLKNFPHSTPVLQLLFHCSATLEFSIFPAPSFSLFPTPISGAHHSHISVGISITKPPVTPSPLAALRFHLTWPCRSLTGLTTPSLRVASLASQDCLMFYLTGCSLGSFAGLSSSWAQSSDLSLPPCPSGLWC